MAPATHVYDVRPFDLIHADAHTASEIVAYRISQAITGLVAHADQERGEVNWTTLRMTVEHHGHTGKLVLRSSARLR